jgi:hypothetical protein
MSDESNRVVPNEGGLNDREIEGLFRLLGQQDDPEVPVSDPEAELLMRLGSAMRLPVDEATRRADRLLERLRAEDPSGGPTAPGGARGGAADAPSTPPANADPSTGAGPGMAASSRSFVTLLEDETDLEGTALAERLGPNLTTSLLLATNRYPQLFPTPVQEELAARAERAFGIATEVLLATFRYEPVLVRRAASRNGAYGAPPASFRELLRYCGLPPEQQMYWIALAGGA